MAHFEVFCCFLFREFFCFSLSLSFPSNCTPVSWFILFQLEICMNNKSYTVALWDKCRLFFQSQFEICWFVSIVNCWQWVVGGCSWSEISYSDNEVINLCNEFIKNVQKFCLFTNLLMIISCILLKRKTNHIVVGSLCKAKSLGILKGGWRFLR